MKAHTIAMKEISELKPAASFINASVPSSREPESKREHPDAIKSYLAVYFVSLDLSPVTSISMRMPKLAKVIPPTVW